MQFDSDDVAALITAGTFDRVVAHEMGHVIGVGTLWNTWVVGQFSSNLVYFRTGNYHGAHGNALFREEMTVRNFFFFFFCVYIAPSSSTVCSVGRDEPLHPRGDLRRPGHSPRSLERRQHTLGYTMLPLLPIFAFTFHFA